MHCNDLQWHLESWLQNRYGPHAVLQVQPCRNLNRGASFDHETFTWLEIATRDGNVPPIAGIRRVPSENGNRHFELIECFTGEEIKRTHWHLDRFDNWQRVIDI